MTELYYTTISNYLRDKIKIYIFLGAKSTSGTGDNNKQGA